LHRLDDGNTVSMPSEGFRQVVFMKAVRSVAKYIAPFDLPSGGYFANVGELFSKVDGVEELLDNPKCTSVRLVTNAEQLVVRETRRAFAYFSLHGLTVDQVIVNRVLPEDLKDDLFREWIEIQQRLLKEIDGCFAPVPVRRVPFSKNEILGYDRLKAVASSLFGRNEDPAAVTRTERPYVFRKKGRRYEVRLEGHFEAKGDVRPVRRHRAGPARSRALKSRWVIQHAGGPRRHQ
jgi:arsenite-transporting ATPase